MLPLLTVALAVTATSAASALSFSGYVQADYQRRDRSSDQLHDGTGAPLNEDAFSIRRARLRAEGQWWLLGFVGETNFTTLGGPQLGARQLEGYARWPEEGAPIVRLGFGIFEVPFGYEVYSQGNLQRLFTERALVSDAFVPGIYDLGVRLSGEIWWLRWAIAVQNGEPLGERAFPGVDPNAAKDIAGRVSMHAPLHEAVSLSGSVSVIVGTGFSPGTQPTKDRVVWRDFNEDGIVQQSEQIAVRGAAGIASENFDRWGVAADVQLRAELPVLGALEIYGELALGVNLDRGVAPEDPITLGRDQRSRGWYVALTQELGPYAAIGARVDRYDPNTDALDLQGGVTVLARRPFTTYTFVVAGRLAFGPARGRALVEYAHQDNALGRDDGGLPARLANDVFRARLEVSF